MTVVYSSAVTLASPSTLSRRIAGSSISAGDDRVVGNDLHVGGDLYQAASQGPCFVPCEDERCDVRPGVNGYANTVVDRIVADLRGHDDVKILHVGPIGGQPGDLEKGVGRYPGPRVVGASPLRFQVERRGRTPVARLRARQLLIVTQAVATLLHPRATPPRWTAADSLTTCALSRLSYERMVVRASSTDANRWHRVRSYGGWWAIAAIFFVIAAWSTFVLDPYRFDLRIYRAAVETLLKGASVYGTGDGDAHPPFTYPPSALFPLVPFGIVSLWFATLAWFVVTMGCLYAAARMCLRAIGGTAAPAHAAVVGWLAAVALQPMRSTFGLGQINIMLLLLVLADAFAVSSRRRGVLTGLSGAVKITPLVFLAWFVVARRRAAAMRGALTFAIATAVTWAVLPSESARYWLHDVFDPSRIGRLDDPLNQSWNGTVQRLMGDGTLATAVWVLLATATIVAGWMSARRFADRGFGLASVAAMAIAGLLASPVSWAHHWVWVFPAAVAGWGLRHDRPPLAWATAALVTVTMVSPWRLIGIPVAEEAWVIAATVWLTFALIAGQDAPLRPSCHTRSRGAFQSPTHIAR
jgi:alpha-1,2-mannosyltransferase